MQRLSTKWRKMAGVSGNDKNGTRDDDGIAWDTRSNAVKIEGKKKKNERCLKSSWNHRTDPDWIFHTKCSYLSRLTFYLSIRPPLNIFDPARVALTEVERTFCSFQMENWVGNKLWNFVILFFFFYLVFFFFFFFNVWKCVDILVIDIFRNFCTREMHMMGQ